MPRPIDLILSVMPELAPAYTPGDHRRAAARLTRDLELAKPGQFHGHCDHCNSMNPCDWFPDIGWQCEACREEEMYQESIASGRITGKGAR